MEQFGAVTGLKYFSSSILTYTNTWYQTLYLTGLNRGGMPSLSFCDNVLSVFRLFLDDFAMNLDREISTTPPLLRSIFKLIISVAPTSSFPHSSCKLIDRSILRQVCVRPCVTVGWLTSQAQWTCGIGQFAATCGLSSFLPDGQTAASAFFQ